MKESLKALRENNNYSQATVAKYLNISRQMYIKYESGEAEPPVKVIVSLSRLYKVTYEEIIDNKISENKIIDNKSIDKLNDRKSVAYNMSHSGELYVASPSSETINNNFELAKTLIPKLTVFEQLKILSLLAASIDRNGANEIAASNVSNHKYRSLSQAEKDELFEKYSGFMKGCDVQDSKDARLEHIYKKYDI